MELFIFTFPEAEPWPDSNDAGELLDAFEARLIAKKDRFLEDFEEQY